MRPVNKRVILLHLAEDVSISQKWINYVIQDHYDDGWTLRYLKFVTPLLASLLFTHAEFDEVPDGDDE